MESGFRRIFKEFRRDLVAQAIDEIDSHADLWDQITDRQSYPGTAHADTKTIFLRWSKDQSLEAAFKDLESFDYPAMGLLPSVARLLDAFQAYMKPRKMGRVILTQLAPAGVIDAHADEDVYADHFQRFHIPLIADEGSTFFTKTDECKGEFASMKPGELWWFDNKRVHWVVNNSPVPRIHLIIDAVVDGFEREYDRRKDAGQV